jgi:hypothetical protein
LLIEVLGEDAICPVCAGTGRVVSVGDDAEGMPRAEPFDPERHPWAQRGWMPAHHVVVPVLGHQVDEQWWSRALGYWFNDQVTDRAAAGGAGWLPRKRLS